MMQQIKNKLEQINRLLLNAPQSQIEKDLLLSHTRDLYDALLQLNIDVPAGESTIQNHLDNAATPEHKNAIPLVAIDKEITSQDSIITHKEIPNDASNKEFYELKIEEELIEEEEVEDLGFNDSFELEVELSDIPEEQAFEEEHDDSTTGNLETDTNELEHKANDFEEEGDSSPQLESQTILPKNPIFFASTAPNDLGKSSEPDPFDFKVYQKDIRSFIGINDKFNFIAELFDHNPEAYEEILNEINLKENKNDALMFLDNSGVTTLYRWKEDGISEQNFYTILNQYFASR